MRIAVPKEILPGERRVALVPESVARLQKSGFEVVVERGAGLAAGFVDQAYEAAGARLVRSAEEALAGAEVVLKVNAPSLADPDETALYGHGQALVALLDPLRNPKLVERLAERGVTAFSLDAIPRITRAQSMDVLSSQATVAGYRAVLIAAARHGKFFPMMMTAAGSIPPAKVFVLGAGVAGLQAIATARRLGAVVEAFDVRLAAREQVESLGGRFVHVDLGESGEGQGGYAKELSEETHRREQELLHEHVKASDVVITTAQVPGKPAPRLVTEAMVRAMQPGSIVVDVAASTGGNCELTKPDEEVEVGGVTVLGPTNLPATMPYHASQMYSRNVAAFLSLIARKDGLAPDFDDEIVKSSCVTHEGKVVFPPLQPAAAKA
ncbi:MAG: Re/Si-specific NAD(P)(+) transhydrogenase subunit alpha [Clostridia bacterium]|nr:Re/Si-specific NAD(P)(+) transhydrogenase subunit alpha [Clostridia bacterium]